MMRTLCALVLAMIFSSPAFAQISGSTTIQIDPDTNIVTASCETDLNSADDGYYAARVTCVVRDSSGNQVASGAYSDEGDYQGYALVTLTFTGIPGTTYIATGGHTAAVTVPFDAPDGGQTGLYFDELNFEAFIESPGVFAVNYEWYGPGPEEETRRTALFIGSTTASGTDQQCPTSVGVNQTWTQPLQNDYPSFSTGVGILTSMLVGPVGTNFDSVVLYETVTPTGNSCPANIKAATDFPTITFSAPFAIGSSAVWEGSPYASVHNAFYDSHVIKSTTNVLGLTNVVICQSTATQVYTCNGNVLGTFTLTNTYSAGSISAQPVTFVSVSKQ